MNFFSKGDTTNWSYELYKITETIKETKPNFKIDNLKESYNEALLKKTMKENDSVKKIKYYLVQIKQSLTI